MASNNGPESTSGSSVMMDDITEPGDLGAVGAQSFTIQSSASNMDDFACDSSSYTVKDSMEKGLLLVNI